MILQHIPEDLPIGFKVHRVGGQKGDWRLSVGGKPFTGRFATITKYPRGLSKKSGGLKESTVARFLGIFHD